MNPIIDLYPYKDFLAKYAKSADSTASYASDLKQLYLFLKTKGHDWQSATPEDFSILFNEFQGKGHQDNTLGRKRACYRKFYGFLLAIEKVKVDPTAILTQSLVLKAAQPNPKALDKDQRKELLKCLEWDNPGSHRYLMSLAIILGLQHGLRRHEIAKIKWEDFDFEAKKLKVLGKGRKLATVPMSPLLIKRLEPIKASEGYLFFEPGGGHVHKGTIQMWVKEVGREWAGFDKSVIFSTHVLRHSACQAWAESGIPLHVCVALSRHSNVNTFINNYVKKDENEAALAQVKIWGEVQ